MSQEDAIECLKNYAGSIEAGEDVMLSVEAVEAAVDALEKQCGIVTCTECEHSCFDIFNDIYCNRCSVSFYVYEDSFCSFGERR